ncbi:MAG: nucleotidyltransferase family protein [Armatimonadetes bacterium]|nr:nucleotidyltransferase family protein [Armatimonadota bacterium]
MLDALVLSGGELEYRRFRRLDGSIKRKALIPILGTPMVEWVVRALRSCPRIQRIAVVGHESLNSAALKDAGAQLVREVGDITSNLGAGLKALDGGRRILILSGDLPLITRESVDDLIDHAPDADFVFPFVERRHIRRFCPKRRWMYLKTRDGTITACSAALCNREVVLDRWRWVENVLNSRRNVVRLATMFGLGFGIWFLLGRLSLADAEARVSSVLRLRSRGYSTAFPELALDVDKQSDIPLVEDHLRQRKTAF